MRYWIKTRDQIYVKDYRLLSFANNMSDKYSQKPLDAAKKSTTDAIKLASKRAVQKTTEATSDLIGNEIADKITSVSKELHSKNLSQNNLHKANNEMEILKERYISPEKKTANYWWIKVSIII